MFLIKVIIVFFVSLLISGISFGTPISFETYQKEAKSYCEDGKPWYKDTTRNAQKVVYPKLDKDSINTWINMQRSQAEDESPIMRDILLAQLDPIRIGSIESSRILEVVQIAYHARMNTVFDCAVVESRKNILEFLKKTIKGQSEILEKIKKEEVSLNQKAKQCIPKDSNLKPGESSINNVHSRLIDTTTLQYCHYRKYLGYLESNLEKNITELNTIDSQIGSGTVKKVKNSDSLQRNLINQQEEIRKEIYVADRAISRAIGAFKEMERTYATHLLLVIIYDDYIRLRDNLARYMSSTSQLFEKSYNAMSP